MSKPLHAIYARAFKNDSFGLSLYHPRPADDLKPGSCGYFNEHGVWRTLFHIDSIDPIDGLAQFLPIISQKDPIPQKCPDKVSEGMTRISVDARAQVT